MSVTAGVVAVQGDVAEHGSAIRRAAASHGIDCTVREIRTAGIVPDCDALLLPGGESTTISRLLHREGIGGEIREHVAADKPLLATCAGLIVASRDAHDGRVQPLELVDVTVERNAFGRQRDSFEASLDVAGLAEPFPAVFIRAPVVRDVGPGVTVLARWDDHPVAIRDGPVLGFTTWPSSTAPRPRGREVFPSTGRGSSMDATIDAVRVAGTPEGPVPVVVLDVGDDTDVLPIFIGFEEARSIARGMDAIDIGRPLTHDLLLDVLEATGSRVVRVVVSEMDGETYIADLHIETPRQSEVVDARPSDSLALASRTGAPIEVATEVFESGRRPREQFDDLQELAEVLGPDE